MKEVLTGLMAAAVVGGLGWVVGWLVDRLGIMEVSGTGNRIGCGIFTVFVTVVVIALAYMLGSLLLALVRKP